MCDNVQIKTKLQITSVSLAMDHVNFNTIYMTTQFSFKWENRQEAPVRRTEWVHL